MLRFLKRIFQHRVYSHGNVSHSSSDMIDHMSKKMGKGAEADFARLSTLCKMTDFCHRRLESVICCYMSTIVLPEYIDTYVIRPLSAHFIRGEVKAMNEMLGGSETEQVEDIEACITKLVQGWAIVLHDEGFPIAVNVFRAPERSVEPSENETTIFGPQENFIESLMTNVGMLRKRMRSADLRFDILLVGKRTNTMVGVLWMEGLANPWNVGEMKRRLESIQRDGITDIAELTEFVEDNPYSPFPNFVSSTQPSKAISALLDGKIVVLADGSPYAWIAPSTFWEFLQSPDDYYNRWLSASLLRFLRMVGLFAALFFTAIYVAIATFHYQMIPSDMLMTLLRTRSKVPFPPLYEALLMEVTIEFLREAGARLPTKIGQTIGIVGGIVIGQAAVSAGFTSNFLIIAVATSTISSFVIPSYLLANAVRVIRYAIIILSAFFGIIGIVIGFVVVMLHLLEMRSLGAPYLSPLIPIRVADWKDSVIRFPFSLFLNRSSLNRAQDVRRGNGNKPS
ncbi:MULTISPECIES: spore germination protein [Aneurinibacillus]|jgi:hypothetical protein|uniref:Spore germination protein n=1 Tax=Aneurinibacillus danicus TaxID=267746 RepID=A0A511V6G4_9BACL|nr:MULTISPECIES: spore germination protein [Aneurinibacillus]GEN33761.1 spore germination protein [Aneurinibacillus danicus]